MFLRWHVQLVVSGSQAVIMGPERRQSKMLLNIARINEDDNSMHEDPAKEDYGLSMALRYPARELVIYYSL